MQSHHDTDSVRAELHAAMMVAFCNVLHTSRLPPMTVMGVMASALGSIYKECADEHRREACPCGWQPASEADVAALQSALAATMRTMPRADLRIVEIAGRA